MVDSPLAASSHTSTVYDANDQLPNPGKCGVLLGSALEGHVWISSHSPKLAQLDTDPPNTRDAFGTPGIQSQLLQQEQLAERNRHNFALPIKSSIAYGLPRT